MRREPNYLLLGATMAMILALFVGVLLFLGGASTWGHRYQIVRIKFAHELPLPKLGSGAEITCGGIPVGKITKVDLEALPAEKPGNAGANSELCLVVEGKVDTGVELRTDCKIRAEAPPLGGTGILIIVHRGYSTQRLTSNDLVAGMAPSGLNAMVGELGDKFLAELDEQNAAGLLHLIKSQLDTTSSNSLMSKALGIANDLQVTASRIRQQLDPQQQGALLAQLDSTLSDVKAITGALREETNAHDPQAMLGKMHGILSALGQASQAVSGMLQDNKTRVAASLSNVQDATAMIKNGIMPSLMAQLDPAEASSLLSKFHVAADKTNATLGNLQDMTGSLRNFVVVNQDALGSTIQNLLETSEHLRAASREIRRNPWRLLYQPKPGEVRQATFADASRSFADAAGKLDSAFARLEAYARTAGPNLPADDPQLKQLQEELALAMKNLTESEKKFWSLMATQQ